MAITVLVTSRSEYAAVREMLRDGCISYIEGVDRATYRKRDGRRISVKLKKRAARRFRCPPDVPRAR